MVHEVSAVLSRHGLSIEAITTDARDAPMAGGMISRLTSSPASRRPPTLPAVHAILKRLATELMVDIERRGGVGERAHRPAAPRSSTVRTTARDPARIPPRPNGDRPPHVVSR